MKKSSKQIISGVMIYFMVVTQVFGQAALLPDGKQQYLDNNGKPLAAGSVEYYVPGSLQKKTTWQNPTQTINNTNPVNLDIGGRGIMYGQGSYRQIVKDTLGNVIWDALTASFGSAAPSGSNGTDTAPVGSIMAFAGSVIPTNWILTYGQLLNRSAFPEFLSAITVTSTNIACTVGSDTLSGFTDVSLIKIGAPIEASCLPPGTTILTQPTLTTFKVSNLAITTDVVTTVTFNWGNGDGTTTFNVPDLRGRVIAGADCMGFVSLGNNCALNLTSSFYGAFPTSPGAYGGSQSKNLTIANINPFVPLLNAYTPQGTVSTASTLSDWVRNTGTFASSVVPAGGPYGMFSDVTALFRQQILSTGTLTGTPVTPTAQSLGSGTAHSVVQPSATANYIIKVKSNTTGLGGVVSLGGMFGDITCGPVLTCTNQEIKTDLSPFKNSIAAPVMLANTAAYFDGPIVTQGSVGTWFASGNATVFDTTVPTGATISCLLWDGTNVISSGTVVLGTPTVQSTISLSGYLDNPLSSLRISCRDFSSVNGFMSNALNGSTISVFRIK